MKILFVFNDYPTANPFVRTLAEELNRQGCYALMSRDELWANMDYDIIHFQWPEVVYQKSHVSEHFVNSLDERLIRIFDDCHKKDIPIFFGLNKFKLGQI